MEFTNIDLHCDLLSYFLFPNSGAKDELGCSIPYLFEGNVALQVMAIYSATEPGSVDYGRQQIHHYKELLKNPAIFQVSSASLKGLKPGRLGIVCAIENASGFCEEEGPLQDGFNNLEHIISECGQPVYIGITHHSENRFGGGNSTKIGLKKDGEALLDYLHNKNIAIDLAHTSDSLAYGILNYIDKKKHNIQILASHSNSRVIYNNNRNLPDELIKEVIDRKGLIGLNFIKDYINKENPSELFRHIEHFVKLGAEDNLSYGADFFFDKAHPDKSRYPFFFDEYKNALAYNSINEKLADIYGAEVMSKVSHRNAIQFLGRLWQ